jgi:predicted RNA-binding Zn-ribbon protein involved in translation (DUF1610 family)
MVKYCPNCGIHAIYYDEDTEPEEKVWCNNCGFEYTFKDLKRQRRS